MQTNVKKIIESPKAYYASKSGTQSVKHSMWKVRIPMKISLPTSNLFLKIESKGLLCILYMMTIKLRYYRRISCGAPLWKKIAMYTNRILRSVYTR